MSALRYLTKEEIEQAVTMKDMIEAVKRAFSMLEKGQIEAPLRTAIKAGRGTLLFMPAYSAELGLAVLKNVNVFPGNAALGRPTTPAEILLIDATNGSALALLDGACVTRLRTGAASGAAFDVLARKNCRKGALIGTGGQAEAQMAAMLAVRDLEEVAIFSPDPAHCASFAERMRAKFADTGVKLTCAPNADACVADADLIVTVTTSETPVFDGKLVKPGATVSCVGAYEPDKHEIDPALIARADKLICDSKAAALSESGDLLIPIAQGLIAERDVLGSLGEVLNGTLPGREREDEIIVFETVGVAAQDLTASAMIYQKLFS